MHYAVHGHIADEMIVESRLYSGKYDTKTHSAYNAGLGKKLNSFIEMFDYGLLKDAGKVSAQIAKLHAETEFEKYRVIQDRLFMSDFDKYLLELEENTKK